MLISLIKTDRAAELILWHARNNTKLTAISYCNIMHTLPTFAARASTSISQPYITHISKSIEKYKLTYACPAAVGHKHNCLTCLCVCSALVVQVSIAMHADQKNLPNIFDYSTSTKAIVEGARLWYTRYLPDQNVFFNIELLCLAYFVFNALGIPFDPMDSGYKSISLVEFSKNLIWLFKLNMCKRIKGLAMHELK